MCLGGVFGRFGGFGLAEHDAVAALPLRLVERGVGATEQRVEAVTLPPEARDADADLEPEGPALPRDAGGRERRPQP